jgi:hypothetical protein
MDAGMKATAVRTATTSSKPMAQKATKVSDTVDVLVGPADGIAGYRRIDVEMRAVSGGGLAINLDIPAELAQPVRQLVAALKASRRIL